MKKYWNGAHTKHRNMYHIVWLPKYRRKVLVGKIKIRIEELLQECADVNGWEIQELNVQSDHVHLMMQLPPSISVSDAVQQLKGTTSRIIRIELMPEIKKMLWGKDFWADGYFSETVGTVSEDRIRDYIKNQ
jgi:putative transposase